MRKLKGLILIIIVIMTFTITVNAYAQDPIRKLGRGLANSLTGMVELPYKIQEVQEENGPAAAATYGVLKGLIDGVYRTLVGVYETATFFIPYPKNYAPIIEPEFVLGDY